MNKCPSVVEKLNIKYKKRTILLDRDGTINDDEGYVHNVFDFKFTNQFKKILPLLARFEGNICLITNQGGVSLGKFSQKESESFTSYVISEMRKLGIEVCMAVACYHHDVDNCPNRKPKPGMVQFVLNEVGVSFHRCIYLGNETKDSELALSTRIEYLDISHPELEKRFMDWLELE